jgi:PmbA protein
MDLLQYLKSEAEQVEVAELHSESTAIEFEANKLKSSSVQETSGTAVRVVRRGRLGFAASTDREAMSRLAANAMESASYGDQVPLHFAGPAAGAPVQVFDADLAGMPIERLVELGQQTIDIIRAVEPEARVNVSLNRGVQTVSVRTAAGAEAGFDRSPLSILVEMSRVENNDVLIIYDLAGGTIAGIDFLGPARYIAQKLEQSKKIASIGSGEIPVLFSPSGALALLLPLMQGLNGKNAYQGISPIAARRGEKLFDEKLTVRDDGTLPGRLGSAPYDDEGTPHGCNLLVDQGVLKGLIYDLKTAALAGSESTGNGVRELLSPPRIDFTNFMVQPGDGSLQEMIAGIDEGLLVEDLLGLGQGNIISGAFSNPLSLAFKIEKGEIVGRVKDVSIAGNIYELLQNIAGVSQETRWVYNAICAPYILLPRMNIVSKN